MSVNYVNLLIAPLTFALLFLVSSSISSFNVYAAPPDPGYNKSNTCGAATSTADGQLSKKTCCWSERIPGKLPPNNTENYCQTCTYYSLDGTYSCNDPQLQRSSPGDVSPEKGSVFEQPETFNEGNDLRNPDIVDGGVLEQREETSNNGNIKNNPVANGELRE